MGKPPKRNWLLVDNHAKPRSATDSMLLNLKAHQPVQRHQTLKAHLESQEEESLIKRLVNKMRPLPRHNFYNSTESALPLLRKTD
jgi:hypothetical protein